MAVTVDIDFLGTYLMPKLMGMPKSESARGGFMACKLHGGFGPSFRNRSRLTFTYVLWAMPTRAAIRKTLVSWC